VPFTDLFVDLKFYWTVLMSLFLILFRNHDQYGEVRSTYEDIEVNFVKQYLYM
jgi:hypothetical protein